MLTSSWFQKLPEGHQVIGISRSSPRGLAAGYRLYKKLAPGDWFKEADPDVYRQRYFSEVLAKLDPQKVWDELHAMAGEKIPVLVCFEKMGGPDWCHRGLVSVWFADTLGQEVYEFDRMADGSGWAHPMLPIGLRQKSSQ